ncbi:hypothetical protein ACHAPT_000017 [Fusarium lateritium]
MQPSASWPAALGSRRWMRGLLNSHRGDVSTSGDAIHRDHTLSDAFRHAKDDLRKRFTFSTDKKSTGRLEAESQPTAHREDALTKKHSIRSVFNTVFDTKSGRKLQKRPRRRSDPIPEMDDFIHSVGDLPEMPLVLQPFEDAQVFCVGANQALDEVFDASASSQEYYSCTSDSKDDQAWSISDHGTVLIRRPAGYHQFTPEETLCDSSSEKHTVYEEVESPEVSAVNPEHNAADDAEMVVNTDEMPMHNCIDTAGTTATAENTTFPGDVIDTTSSDRVQDASEGTNNLMVNNNLDIDMGTDRSISLTRIGRLVSKAISARTKSNLVLKPVRELRRKNRFPSGLNYKKTRSSSRRRFFFDNNKSADSSPNTEGLVEQPKPECTHDEPEAVDTYGQVKTHERQVPFDEIHLDQMELTLDDSLTSAQNHDDDVIGTHAIDHYSMENEPVEEASGDHEFTDEKPTDESTDDKSTDDKSNDDKSNDDKFNDDKSNDDKFNDDKSNDNKLTQSNSINTQEAIAEDDGEDSLPRQILVSDDCVSQRSENYGEVRYTPEEFHYDDEEKELEIWGELATHWGDSEIGPDTIKQRLEEHLQALNKMNKSGGKQKVYPASMTSSLEYNGDLSSDFESPLFVQGWVQDGLERLDGTKAKDAPYEKTLPLHEKDAANYVDSDVDNYAPTQYSHFSEASLPLDPSPLVGQTNRHALQAEIHSALHAFDARNVAGTKPIEAEAAIRQCRYIIHRCTETGRDLYNNIAAARERIDARAAQLERVVYSVQDLVEMRERRASRRREAIYRQVSQHLRDAAQEASRVQAHTQQMSHELQQLLHREKQLVECVAATARRVGLTGNDPNDLEWAVKRMLEGDSLSTVEENLNSRF